MASYTYTALTYGETDYAEKTFPFRARCTTGEDAIFDEEVKLSQVEKPTIGGDEVDKSIYVFFTTDLGTAAAYAEQSRSHVFEVESTGSFSIDYSGNDFKTKFPLNVIRKLDPQEWEQT